MVGGTQARACLEAVFSVRPKAAAPPPKGDDRTAIRRRAHPVWDVHNCRASSVIWCFECSLVLFIAFAP